MTPVQRSFIDMAAQTILGSSDPEDLFRSTIRLYRKSVSEAQPGMPAAEVERHVGAFTSDLLDRIDEIEEHGPAIGTA